MAISDAANSKAPLGHWAQLSDGGPRGPGPLRSAAVSAPGPPTYRFLGVPEAVPQVVVLLDQSEGKVPDSPNTELLAGRLINSVIGLLDAFPSS